MTSFDEALSNFVAPGTAPLSEMKQKLEPTLQDLRELKRSFPKKQAAWQSRLERISTRYQAARALGVFRSSIASRLEELTGGRALHGGLLVAVEQQINAAIYKIERLTSQDIQQRRWISWPGEPQKIRDNMAEIELLLTQLESITKDGGELEGLLRQKSGQAASAPVLVSPERDAPITVET